MINVNCRVGFTGAGAMEDAAEEEVLGELEEAAGGLAFTPPLFADPTVGPPDVDAAIAAAAAAATREADMLFDMPPIPIPIPMPMLD